MADILSLQTPYADGETVTSDNLNNLVKQASFTDAAVDGVTTQLSGKQIIVCDTAGNGDQHSLHTGDGRHFLIHLRYGRCCS